MLFALLHRLWCAGRRQALRHQRAALRLQPHDETDRDNLAQMLNLAAKRAFEENQDIAQVTRPRNAPHLVQAPQQWDQ